MSTTTRVTGPDGTVFADQESLDAHNAILASVAARRVKGAARGLHPDDFLAPAMQDNPVAKALSGAIWMQAIETDTVWAKHQAGDEVGSGIRAERHAMQVLCEAAQQARIWDAQFASAGTTTNAHYFLAMAKNQRPTV